MLVEITAINKYAHLFKTLIFEVNIFLTMFRDSQVRKQTHVKLTYPTMDVFGHRVYLANNIFLVNINNRLMMQALLFSDLYPTNGEAILKKRKVIRHKLILKHAYCQ